MFSIYDTEPIFWSIQLKDSRKKCLLLIFWKNESFLLGSTGYVSACVTEKPGSPVSLLLNVRSSLWEEFIFLHVHQHNSTLCINPGYAFEWWNSVHWRSVVITFCSMVWADTEIQRCRNTNTHKHAKLTQIPQMLPFTAFLAHHKIKCPVTGSKIQWFTDLCRNTVVSRTAQCNSEHSLSW